MPNFNDSICHRTEAEGIASLFSVVTLALTLIPVGGFEPEPSEWTAIKLLEMLMLLLISTVAYPLILSMNWTLPNSFSLIMKGDGVMFAWEMLMVTLY